MVDRLFSDPALASLYDTFGVGRRDFAFYLPIVMSSSSVLDVGCGTGALLHAARAAGHTGRLCGLDPANGMLQHARKRTDVEWILGDLGSIKWDRQFELALMTGHAFQVFVDDAEIRAALTAIRSALSPDGRLAFETRNPVARGWEKWTPDNAVEIEDDSGATVRMSHHVDAVEGERVAFTTTYTCATWDEPRLSRSTLRFLGQESLAVFLAAAGFVVEEQYGYWDRTPVTDASPEIITIARPAR